MRFFRRWPLVNRFASWRCIPKLEALEDRSLPATGPLFGQFQSALGLLSLHGDSAHHLVTASLSTTGFLQVHVGNQVATSDPHSTAYDPALAGATAQTLQAIQFDGSAGLDDLVLGNLTVAGGLSVQSDGALDVQGQVSAAGPIQLYGATVQLGGQVRADGATGGNITVTAGNVLQSGLLEADGSQGSGGAVTVDFSGHYLATASSLTAANSTGTGSGGLVVIDGFSTGIFFSSGRYQANAVQGGQGGDIDLFAKQVRLVGAHIDASGPTGGGWVRVGGDSPSDIAAHGGSAAGVSDADTTTVTAGTTLTANALSAGNGGRIVVWSQDTTFFGGTLAAQGAGANGTGGLLEVSSAGQLTYGGHASATASSGKQGRLLLDPKNLIISAGAGLPQFNLVNPETDGLDSFGSRIAVLSNGNVVVTDPTSNLAAANAGAVFLFDGQTGALLGTLTGSTSGDEVGSGGITVLNNGNFVVSSPLWQGVGAATWIAGSSNFAASVSAANSLIGSTSGDQVGNSVTALANGNYVVASPDWHNAGAMVGAVTWGDGVNGTFGAVSASNSLVGATDGDQIGSDGVTALTNGNYVVSSSNWHNPDGSFGAATWGNGAGGTIGPVAAVNSLVGSSTSGGHVGGSVTALSDGNYVVSSASWNPDNTFSDVGAATWGNGSTGTVGVVSASNSLIGDAGTFDSVAGGGVTALTNGNYVVSSPSFQDGTAYIGAVTFGAAGGGTVGLVSASNSLVGSTDGDGVGSGGVIALSNGSYVVVTPGWQNAGAAVVGAVTWGAANGSTVGTISATNSLLGTHDGDAIGSGGVTALSNGNYVVSSPNWQNAGTDVGAVTLAQADGSTLGAVSIANSLVGSANGDDVGSGGVTALSNGNYVVSSPNWHNLGAVTLGLANGSAFGLVNAGNSFVGSTSGDDVGSGGITVLSNGNYLISSPGWHKSGAQVGAVTWINGSTGQTLDGALAIDAANSLIGASSSALLGQVVGLQGGASFLASFSGHGGAVTVVQLTPQSETFATASTLTLTLSPSFLTETLDTGTAVVLQASNDITVADPILVNNPTGNGGDLTLQAGRNILILASITTDNGNLTLIANDNAADGVVNSERDGGNTAAITMVPGPLLNAGTGNVTVMEDAGTGNTNFASDDITLGDIIGHNVSILNYGLGDGSLGGVSPGGGADMDSVNASGNLTVYSTFDISQAGAQSVTDPDILRIAGTTSLTAVGAPDGGIILDNNANTFGGTVTYNDPGRDVTINASGNLTLASATTAASLTASAGGALTSSGPLAVSGAANFTGATVTLTDSQNDFGGVVSLISGGATSLTDAAALTLGSPDILGGSLTLAGPTALTAPSITFIGAVNVGAQTLTLNSNTPVDLNSDTTIAGGTIADSSGLIVGTGGTLSGSGTLQVGAGAAGLLVQTGGTLSPDLNPAGLTVNGDLTLSPGSVLAEQIQSAAQFAELNVNGAINLGNGTLQVAFLNPYQPTAFTPFQILNNTPGTAITGAFAQGTSVAAGSNVLGIDYAGGIGNNVVLTVQGPPAIVASLPLFSLTSFNVSWSGTEYAAGASIFNVYVSDDAGPFTLWQSDTTQTSATYTGQFGHTYSFFSVYTDDAANTTPVSQASTTARTVPILTWSNPADISYGTALSATQLDASASVLVAGSPVIVAGTYTYTLADGTTSASGAILHTGVNQILNVSFVPTDGTSFTTATDQVEINVSPKTLTVSIVGTPTKTYDGGTAATLTSASFHVNGLVGSDSFTVTQPAGVYNSKDTNAGTVSATLAGSSFSAGTGTQVSDYILPTSASGAGAITAKTLTVALVGTPNKPYDGTTAAALASSNFQLTGLVGAESIVVTPTTGVYNSKNTNAATVSATLAANNFSAAAGTLTSDYVLPTSATGAGTIAAQTLTATIIGNPTKIYNGTTSATLTPGSFQLTGLAGNESFTVTQTAGAYDSKDTTAATVSAALAAGNFTAGAGTLSSDYVLPTTASGPGTITPASQTINFNISVPVIVGIPFTLSAVGGASGNPVTFSLISGPATLNGNTLLANGVGTIVLQADQAGNLDYTAAASVQSDVVVNSTYIFPAAPETANGTPTAVPIATMIKNHFGDADKTTKPGIAITELLGAGVWQYFNGLAWANITNVSETNALLLPQTDKLRFVPTGLQPDTGDLLFNAWDGSLGTIGGRANVTNRGGGTPFSTNAGLLTVNVTAVTAAPVWLATTTALTPVAPGGTNAGESVQQAFGAQFSGDNGQQPGIAIVGQTGTASGVWQYALYNSNMGSVGPFQNLGTVSASAARLLGAQDLIRFVPTNASFIGSVTLLARAWDGSTGSDGGIVTLSKTTSVGGKTAFSSTVLTAKQTFDHAPTQNATAGIPLTATAENVISKTVTVASLLKAAGALDSDKGTSLGLALTSAAGPGAWQYQLSSVGAWQVVPGTVSASSALLLPAAASLRFVPTTNQTGSATLSWAAWDVTQGTAGTQGFAIPNPRGGATAFSSNIAAAALTVTPSLTTPPPAWSGTGAAFTPVVPNTTPPGDTVASVFSSYFEAPGSAVGIAVSAVTGTTSGTWFYSLDGGTTWVSLNAVSSTKAVLLAGSDLIRFVPKATFLGGTATLTAHAWDAVPSKAGTTVNLLLKGATGGASGIGTGTLATPCLVNTAPTLV